MTVSSALILAAGVGERLGPRGREGPKALLSFGGRTLLDRHLHSLAASGIEEVAIAVGHHADAVAEAAAANSHGCAVRVVTNPRYRDGSILSLWTLRDALAGDGPVLLMDADVLYDPKLLEILVASRHPISLLMDRDFEPGDEPVKICMRDGRIVDFRKAVDRPDDVRGESVGFFKFSAAGARALAAAAERYVAAGRTGEPYEEAVRDVLLAAGPGEAGVEDITGLPWIEIDFPEDIERAEAEILPRLPRRR